MAGRLKMDIPHTAAGIFEVANAKMASLVFRCVVSHGYDPRDFVLYAYGGGGAMHAAFYAADLSVIRSCSAGAGWYVFSARRCYRVTAAQRAPARFRAHAGTGGALQREL